MTFGVMYLELMARMENLSAVRAKRFINDAYNELADCYAWPWTLTEAAGAAPLWLNSAGNPRKIVSVWHGPLTGAGGRQLTYYPIAQLVADGYDLSDTGDPWAWNFERDEVDTIGVFPRSTDTITAIYHRVITALSADGDTPSAPDRYHGLIVDMAQLRACRRHRENATLVPFLQQQVGHELGKMIQDLMSPSMEPLRVVHEGW